MVIVVVAGSRSIDDFEYIHYAMVESPWWPLEAEKIIHGGADGVDSLADEFADIHNIPVEVFEAAWDEYGKSAGPIRNSQMADEADCLTAVWDGESSGTRDMIEKALNKNLDVYVKQVD